jgi:hypothetical protein
MRCTEETLMPVTSAIAAAVQWVASPGGSPAISSTTRAITPKGVLIAVPVMSELQVVLDEAVQKRRKQLIEKLEESGARLNDRSSGGIAATMRDGRATSKPTKSDRFSPLDSTVERLDTRIAVKALAFIWPKPIARFRRFPRSPVTSLTERLGFSRPIFPGPRRWRRRRTPKPEWLL